MNYFQDSVLELRWTSQHNCGHNNHCQYVIQYSCEGNDMLGENVRDGHPQNALGDTCTDTIPENIDENIYKSNSNFEFDFNSDTNSESDTNSKSEWERKLEEIDKK